MLFDLILLAALAACITYCIILSKKINELNSSKVNLNNLFDKFDESITKASSSLSMLNKTSETTIKNLTGLIQKGEELSNELNIANELSKSKPNKSEHHNISQNYIDENLNIKETSKLSHENKLAYSINRISSPQDFPEDKKTLDQNQYFSSLKKISTKNEI